MDHLTLRRQVRRWPLHLDAVRLHNTVADGRIEQATRLDRLVLPDVAGVVDDL